MRFIDPMGMDTVNVNSPQPVKKDDVVVMEDGSTATASVDEIVVTPDNTSNDNQSTTTSEPSTEQATVIAPPIPWYITTGEVISTGVLRTLGTVSIFLTIPGDTDYRRYDSAADSGKNEKHGDSGAYGKAERQIADLEAQLAAATSNKARQKIKQKIKNVRENAQKNSKGEEHSRANKR